MYFYTGIAGETAHKARTRQKCTKTPSEPQLHSIIKLTNYPDYWGLTLSSA